MAVAIYSAVKGISVDNKVAMTGELSIRGLIRPVGGVSAKIYAAEQAGVRRVLIPKDNWQESYQGLAIEVIAIESLEEALEYSLIKEVADRLHKDSPIAKPEILAAAGIQI